MYGYADSGRTMSLARERPNLLVTRTFSKAHGLCGLRVGYALGSSDFKRAVDIVVRRGDAVAYEEGER